MSDPSGWRSAVLQRAAQPPGESAVGDGIEGKVFCDECLLRMSVELVVRKQLPNVQFGYANVYQWRTYVLHE